MSSIEDRIVRMRFENADFENRVSRTMSTLDKLKAKLKFKDASDSVQKLQSGINSLTFAPLLKGIDSIERRFSAVGIAGATLIHNLTNSAINAAKSLEQATIGQIKSGGWSRAMNIANAQFQIEGLGYAWEKVEKAVSYGVKDTAYGLDAAAAAASQLAASGVDFEKVVKTVNGQGLTQMHKSLRAISGVAAMTNSSYEDIARIFTTVAGNGRLMGDQLLQLSGRGMNAAATLAKALHKTEAEVRDMVSRGKIDYITFANAMDDAFGDHAKEANKTFTGALSNMKAALSRFGAVFATPIIGKTNTFFIALTKRIDEMKASISDVDEKTPRFATHFAEAWQAGVDAMTALVEKVDLGWFDRLAQKADAVTVKIRDFFTALKDFVGGGAKETAKSVNDATKSLLVSAEEAAAAKDVIAGVYGSGTKRKEKLTEKFGEQAAKNIQAYVDSVAKAGWKYEKATIKIQEANKNLDGSSNKTVQSKLLERIKTAIPVIKTLGAVTTNVFTAIKKITYPVIAAISNAFGSKKLINGTYSFSAALLKFSKSLIISDSTAIKIYKLFTKIGTIMQNVFTVAKRIVEPVLKAFWSVFSNNKLVDGTSSFADSLVKLSKSLIIDDKTQNKIFKFFTKFFKVIQMAARVVGKYATKAVNSTTKFVESGKLTKIWNAVKELITKISDEFVKLFSGKDSIVSKISGLIGSILSAVSSSLSGINAGSIVKALMVVFFVKKVLSAVTLIGGAGSIVSNASNALSSISTMFSNLSLVFKQIKKNIGLMSKALAIEMLAKAIAMIGAIVIIMSLIPSEKLQSAVVVVGEIVFLMGMVALLFSHMVKNTVIYVTTLKELGIIAGVFSVFGTFLVQMAGAFALMGAAMTIMGAIDPDRLGGVIKSMVTVMIILGLFAVIGEKLSSSITNRGTFALIGAFMIMAASAIVVMASAMAILGTIKTRKIVDTIHSMVVIFGTLSLLTFIVSKLSVKPLNLAFMGIVGLFMIQAAAAFVVMASAMAIIGTVHIDKMNGVMVAMLEIMIAFLAIGAIFTAITSSLSSLASMAVAGVFLIEAATAFVIMASAMAIIGSIDTKNIRQCLVVFGLISAVIIILIAAVGALSSFTGTLSGVVSFTIIGAFLIEVAAAFVVMASAMAIIGSIDTNKIKQCITIFGLITVVVGLLVSAIAAITSGATDVASELASVFKLGLAASAISTLFDTIGNMMLSVSKYANRMSWDGVQMMLAIIAGFIITFYVLADSIGKLGKTNLSTAVGILVMSISIGLLTSTMIGLSEAASKVSWDGVMKALTMMLGVSLIFSSVVRAFSEFNGSALAMIGGILAMSIGVMLFTSALKTLSGVKGVIKNALAVTILIIAITAALLVSFKALSKMDSMTTDMSSIGFAFIMITASMLILAQALREMSTIGDGIWTGIKIIAAFAGIMVALGLIIGFLPGIATGMMKVGQAFLYAGLGMALVGASVYLVAAGIEKLSTCLVPFSVGLAALFAVLQENKGTAIIVGIAIIAVLAAAAYFMSKLAPLIEAIAKVIMEFITFLGGILSKASNKVVGFMGNMSGRLKFGIMALIRIIQAAIVGSFPGVLVTIGEMLLNLLDFLNKIAGPLADGLVVFLVGVINGVADAIRMNSSSILFAIWNVIYSIGQLIVEALISVIGPIWNAIANVLGTQTIEEALNLDEWRKNSEEAMEIGRREAKEADDIRKQSTKSFKEIAEEYKKSSDSSNESILSVIGNMVGLGNTSEKTAKQVEDSYSHLPQAAKDAMVKAGVYDYEEGFKGAADSAGESFGDSLLNKLSSLSGGFAGEGADAADEFSTGFSDNLDFSKMLSSEGTLDNASLEEMMKAFNGTGSDLSTNFINGFTDDSAFEEATNTNLSGVTKASKKYNTDAYNGGADIGSSMSQGVSDTRSEMIAAAGNMLSGITEAMIHYRGTTGPEQMRLVCQAMLDEYTKFNLIASPSKLYAEKTGFLLQGITDTLRNGRDSAGRSMSDLSEIMVVSFGDPLSEVAKRVSGEIPIDTKIRPVVDMSTASSSSRAINTMFNGQQVSLSGFSGKLSADLGQISSNNSDIVAELVALRTDMQDMTERIESMQIVMDSGALVGSIAGDMDSALGRRSVYKRRGN